jgi:hypothetical protein
MSDHDTAQQPEDVSAHQLLDQVISSAKRLSDALEVDPSALDGCTQAKVAEAGVWFDELAAQLDRVLLRLNNSPNAPADGGRLQ